MPPAATTPVALDPLLAGLIDYAGLFPPAALDMAAAVEEYVWAAGSPDRAALARFVVPAARLEEFASAVTRHPGQRGWLLSALVGDDVGGDLRRIEAINALFGADGLGHAVDSVELRAASPEEATDRLRRLPSHLTRFVEFPAAAEPEPFLDVLARDGAAAKIRMGGITAEAFPDPAHVIRFVAACVAHRVPFKATAGLHHPLRARYRLTYAPDAAHAPMYGYLNLFLAAALLQQGGDAATAQALLLEESAAAFTLAPDAISWRGHRLDHAALQTLRRDLALGIGSCSFREPLDDLRALHLGSPARQPDS